MDSLNDIAVLIPWQPILVITILIVLDYLTGVGKGIKNKDLNSGKMREGIWHKAGYYGLVILAIVFELACAVINFESVSTGFGITLPELPAVSVICAFIAITEILSIFENLCAINPTIAKLPFAEALRPHAPSDPDLVVAVEPVKAIEEANETRAVDDAN